MAFGRKKKKEHIKYAKEVAELKKENSIGKCPKCGSPLVLRTGKYGEFLGCSNYPRCRYTQEKKY